LYVVGILMRRQTLARDNVDDIGRVQYE